MRTSRFAPHVAVGMLALLAGCTDLWGGFNRDNPLHCASQPNFCQANEVCNMQTGMCDTVPTTDIVPVQQGMMSCQQSGAMQACWQAYTLQGSSATLRAVWTDGPTDVWVVGDGGLVLRYDGTNWHKVPSGTQSNLNAIWGGSATDIWIVGDASTSLHWTGTALMADSNPGTNVGVKDYCCVWGSSANDIWIAASHMNADQYVLSHYANASWTRINPMQNQPARMVPQALTGLTEGSNTVVQLIGDALLVHTDVMGFPAVAATATALKPGGGFIPAGGLGFLVGASGAIAHSTDKTLTSYVPVSSPTMNNLHDLWGASDGTLIAVGDNGTTVGRVAGVWQTEAVVTAASLHRVWGSDTTNIWAVGDAGTILTRTLQ